jgi:hypothetical protein
VDDVLKLRFTLPVFKLEQPQQPETPPTTT